MPCECGYADECDGETAVFYPLQDGGMCAVLSCKKPRDDQVWDREAERITRECFGEDVLRPINPNATCVDDL